MAYQYSEAEKVRLQALKEAEATLVDIALYASETDQLTQTQAFSAIRCLMHYASEESFSHDCREWLREALRTLPDR